MSSREEFLFDSTSGINPVGRGNVKRITVELAKGFAMYLGGGLSDLLGGKGSMTKFRWAMVLEDGGTLESLPMSASEFTRTIGGAIPYEVIRSLINVAGISVVESKTLSLRQLIDLAGDRTDGRWPDNVRNAIQYMIETASTPEQFQSSSLPEEPEGEPPGPPISDGPFEPNSFKYGGKVTTELSPNPYRLLKALWNASGRTRDFDSGLDTEVWLDHGRTINRGLVEGPQREINNCFFKAEIHLRVSVGKDKVILKELSKEEFLKWKKKRRRPRK